MMGMMIMIACVICLLITTASSDKALIERVCKGSVVKDFCVKTLESDPAAWQAGDNLTLAKAALALITKNTVAAQKDIQAAAGTASVPAVKAALQHCVDSYTSILQSVGSATKELDEDPQSASYDMFASMDFVNECKDQLPPDVPSVPAIVQQTSDFIRLGIQVTDAIDSV